MTESQARYLATWSKDYVARKVRGQWVVWSKLSDHAVDFDSAALVQANVLGHGFADSVGLSEVTEASMTRAHQAGMAYWRSNRPSEVTKEGLQSVARSCGWHGGDCYAWVAGFYGAKRRDNNS